MNKLLMTSVSVLVTAGLAGMAATSAAEAGSAPLPHVHLALDTPAPEILATTLDGKPASLATLRGKPVVLEFGSLTEPVFRMRAAAVEKLAQQYDNRAVFVVLYEREAHPADTDAAIEANSQDGYEIAMPTTQSERCKVAQQAVDRLHLTHEKIFVDAWSNTTALRYGNYPNMTFIIDANGKLQAGYPWMDPKKVQVALDALLAGKAVPSDARGTVRPANAPVAGGNESAGMEMANGGGMVKVAMLIDKLKLTNEQKATLYPPLSQFISDLRDVRETRAGKPAKSSAATTQGAGDAVAPEDLQTAIQKLQASAEKLKAACKQALPEDQATQMINALEEGPARRLFADK